MIGPNSRLSFLQRSHLMIGIILAESLMSSTQRSKVKRSLNRVPVPGYGFGFLGTTSPGTHSHSHSRSRSGSPTWTPHLTAPLSITRQEVALPQAPSYDESVRNEDDWLKGTFDGMRTIMLFYNPDPECGIIALNERATGVAAGLGTSKVDYISDVVSDLANDRTYPISV